MAESEVASGSTAVAADLAAERLLPLLETGRFGRIYRPVATCGSTNDLCAREAREGAPEGLLVVADSQTGGRGRFGRRWLSPPGQNLYFSLLLRPAVPAQSLPPLTLVAGAAVAEVLHRFGVAARLKWPNDVLVDDGPRARKLVGILTEMATERDQIRHVVLGIGVDVNQREFPPELAEVATSVRLARTPASEEPIDRAALLAAIVNALEPACDQAFRDGGAASLQRWRALAALPRACRIDRSGESLTGTALDVDGEGALLVEDAEGRVHRVLSGELVPL